MNSEKSGLEREQVEEKPDFDSLLKQVDKLESDLEAERKKNADQINRMKYLQADLVNLQRQTDRMVSEAKNDVKINWILEIISIKEDIDRALNSEGDRSTLTEGLKLLESRIANDLRAEGVEAINVRVGAPFDPKYYEAVGYQETNDKAEGSIVSVISNGYTVAGKVVRPVLVEVARQKMAGNQEQAAESAVEK
jgi:molecular chaperone GrpE